MGQITATRNLVAIKVVRHAGQWSVLQNIFWCPCSRNSIWKFHPQCELWPFCPSLDMLKCAEKEVNEIISNRNNETWRDELVPLPNPWWRHQMETFSALLAICAGNSPVTGEFPAQRSVTRAMMFSLICAWINDWVHNREAGDLRHHHAHYDVIIMHSFGSPKWVRHQPMQR